MPLIALLERAGNVIAYLCLVIAALGLFVIVGINALNIGLRFFFNYAWSWAEEAEIFVMIASVFGAAVTASWRSSHMRLDMFVNRMPASLQRITHVVVTLFSVAVLLGLSSSSYQVVSLLYRFGQKSAALEFPMWIPQGCVLAGFVLIAVMMLLRLAIYCLNPARPGFENVAEP
jgi:TRAP-type C4-dicarboxylate transport system permease small subunit